MRWGGGDLLGFADFDDFAMAHDGDAGGEVAHDGHGVGDEQVGQAELFLQTLEQVYDLGGDADVEGADGLVGDDEAGTQGEGAGDADALALAAAELVGIAAQGADVEADGAPSARRRAGGGWACRGLRGWPAAR